MGVKHTGLLINVHYQTDLSDVRDLVPFRTAHSDYRPEFSRKGSLPSIIIVRRLCLRRSLPHSIASLMNATPTGACWGG